MWSTEKYIHKQFANTLNKFQYILFPTNYLQRNNVYKYTKLTSIWHIALWSFINMLLVITDPNFFLKRPKSARLDVWRLPAFEAPGHVRPWRPPRRLCSATAPQLRPGLRAPPGAAAFRLGRFFPGSRRPLWASVEDDGPQRPMRRGRTTEVVGMLSSTRSTDKGTMNVLDLKQNTFIYKHSRHLFYNTTFAEMMCKDFFNEEASKDNVIPGSW